MPITCGCPSEGHAQGICATKQLKVNKLPPVLTIQLKRFTNGRLIKDSSKVNFDLSLDMQPFMAAAAGGDCKMELFALVIHSGPSMNGGHFYSVVRGENG